MSSYPLYQIDAFTREPFKGNPAAVCIVDEFPQQTWMQALAAEMNLSETAFVCARGERFDLRWFTPSTEVDLCGHATLATAHALWQSGVLPRDNDAVFDTRSGELRCEYSEQGIRMRFPLDVVAEVEMPASLDKVLGFLPAKVWRGVSDLLVELDSAEQVAAFKPDLNVLKAIDARGLIVTAWVGDENTDFVSRFFGPAAGIYEDPVTGSAHCTLTDYWRQKSGQNEFRAEQVSKRGGRLLTRLEGNDVVLIGDAVMVFETRINR